MMNNKLIFFLLFFYLTIHSLNSANVEPPDCEDLRQKFANASANFTLCAIDHSRPITLCESCINTYTNVLESFENMSKVFVDNTTCLDLYVTQDRLQIVQILYGNNVDLWTRAKCYECYEDNKLSNKTKQFQEYYGKYNSCLSDTTPENICLNCLKDYTNLDNYYKIISNINEKIGVCMDLVDVMNTTWIYWSYKCCKFRRHDEYIFIGSSVGVLIITILFYFAVQFYKENNAPTIIQQSRFFESLNIFRD